MGRDIKDLTGQKIAMLTIRGLSHMKKYKSGSKAYWDCICDCGNTAVVESGNIGKGTVSCGCKRGSKCK